MRIELDSSAPAMARGAAANLAGSLVVNVLAFAFTYALTRILPADEIGLFAIATAVVALVSVPTVLGLDTAVIRFVALGAAVDDERAARGSLQLAVVIASATSVVATGLVWSNAAWLAEQLFHKPETAELLRITVLSLPAIAIARVVTAAIRGYGVMSVAAQLGVISRILDVLTALPLLALGFGVEGLAVASALAAYVTVGVAVRLLLRVHPRALTPAAGAWPLRRLLAFSAPQTMTALFFFGVARLDTLLLARFASASEVGIYSIATRLLAPASLLSTSIGQMFAPRIAAEDARRDRAALGMMLKRVTYWNTTVSLPFFAALAVIPAPLLSLFGEQYADGATALAVLAVGQLVNTAAGPLGQVINMSGRPYITMPNNAFVTLLNVGVGLVLIPRYGLVGAAVSTAGALTVGNAVKLVLIRTIFGLTPFRADTAKTLLAGAAATVAAATVAFVPAWPNALLASMVGLLALFAVYVFALRVAGLHDDEREVVAATKAVVRGRVRARRPRWMNREASESEVPKLRASKGS